MNKEEMIKKALVTDVVLTTICNSLKKGNPIELKIEKDKLVVVDIERHARTKIELSK